VLYTGFELKFGGLVLCFFVSRMWGLFYVNIVRQDAERSAYVSEYYAAVIWPDLWLENSRGVLQLQARNDVYFQAAVPTAWRLGSQILSALANSGETTFLFCFHLSHESREDLVRSTRMLFRNFKAYSLREI